MIRVQTGDIILVSNSCHARRWEKGINYVLEVRPWKSRNKDERWNFWIRLLNPSGIDSEKHGKDFPLNQYEFLVYTKEFNRSLEGLTIKIIPRKNLEYKT